MIEEKSSTNGEGSTSRGRSQLASPSGGPLDWHEATASCSEISVQGVHDSASTS